jgi:hypothetical protein
MIVLIVAVKVGDYLAIIWAIIWWFLNTDYRDSWTQLFDQLHPHWVSFYGKTFPLKPTMFPTVPTTTLEAPPSSRHRAPHPAISIPATLTTTSPFRSNPMANPVAQARHVWRHMHFTFLTNIAYVAKGPEDGKTCKVSFISFFVYSFNYFPLPL